MPEVDVAADVAGLTELFEECEPDRGNRYKLRAGSVADSASSCLPTT